MSRTAASNGAGTHPGRNGKGRGKPEPFTDAEAAGVARLVAQTKKMPANDVFDRLAHDWADCVLTAFHDGPSGLEAWLRNMAVRLRTEPTRFEALRHALDTATANVPPCLTADGSTAPLPRPLSPSQLYASRPSLRTPIIHDVLRRTEIMNLIAPSKAGKSWLALGLALSVGGNRPWLGRFDVNPGRVLLLDNELHEETIAHRMRWVAEAMGLDLADYDGMVAVESFRGRLVGLAEMRGYFEAIAGLYSLVILDAAYRFTVPGESENDNAAMTARYNLLDQYADVSGAAISVVHHSSKGTQEGKAVTDVGAGGGAQSRAADTHLVLLNDSQIGPGRLVVDAAIRSFPPIEPFVIRREGPLWLADGEVPAKPDRKRTISPEMFAAKYAQSTPQTKEEILFRANQDGMAQRPAKAILQAALTQGFLHPWKNHGDRYPRYSTCKQEVPDDPSGQG
jgi:hypothetical protein